MIYVYLILIKYVPTLAEASASAGINTKMIGRSDEFDLLKTTFINTTQDKKRHMITVFGEAGIGKSRLRFEFEKWIKQQHSDFSCFRARGRDEDRDIFLY